VLGVTAKSDTLASAADRAYAAAGKITFDGEFHRTDIGKTVDN
jgi:phosphoribosylamine-glycine ligase